MVLQSRTCGLTVIFCNGTKVLCYEPSFKIGWWLTGGCQVKIMSITSWSTQLPLLLFPFPFISSHIQHRGWSANSDCRSDILVFVDIIVDMLELLFPSKSLFWYHIIITIMDADIIHRPLQFCVLADVCVWQWCVNILSTVFGLNPACFQSLPVLWVFTL